MIKNITFFCLLIISTTISCQEHTRKIGRIITGAEQISSYDSLIAGKKVGLVVNQSSIINHTLLPDSLLALGINIRIIFSPEHGFGGAGDAGEYMQDEEYKDTGIKIISLYGRKKKPAGEDLSDLDILMYDIQDVGVRFYTYISTLHYAMESCAESDIPLLVLDRPNPNGFYVDGPVLKPEYKSFLGMHPLPVVYGLTAGELATMINGEKWLKEGEQCRLTVIRCKNYTHKDYYNLPVNPSPNLKSMKAVYLYPTLGLFTGTVMSMGRGTDFPFLVIGHPDYPDHTFSYNPLPKSGARNPKYNGETCYGLDLRNEPVDSIRHSEKIDIEFFQMIYNKMNMGTDFFNSSFNYHAGNNELRRQILNDLPADTIRKSWEPALGQYKKTRKKYLLYPDFE